MQPESHLIESNDDFSIDAEFKNLLPGLDDDARRELELSIVREGCRDALVVWQEERLLIDGHHRYDICVAHGIPFKIREVSLKGRLQVRIWILQNNAARRHLPESMRALFAAQLAQLLIEEGKEVQRANLVPILRGTVIESHICDSRRDVENKGLINSGKATERAAKQFGVGRRQVEDAITVLNTGIPDLVKELATMPIHRAARIAKLPKERQKAVLEADDQKAALDQESRSVLVREVEEVYILRRFLKNWGVTMEMLGVHNRQLLIRMVMWLMRNGNELMQTTAAPYLAVAVGVPYAKEGVNDTHEQILEKWRKAVEGAAEDLSLRTGAKR